MDRGDRLSEPTVSVGGHQLHPAQATIGYRAQEGQPEGAVLTGAAPPRPWGHLPRSRMPTQPVTSFPATSEVELTDTDVVNITRPHID